MDRESERIGLQEIIDKALEEMPREAGESFELDRINLAEFSRRTGLTRSRARTLKANGFKVLPHGRCGMRAATTVMSGFEGVADALLADGVTNSDVIFERISERGYRGGLTTVKNYIAAHADLVPAKRRLARAEPQGSRGRRFETGPGEAYQMDWGFVEVEDWTGATFRIACLALVCHHCGWQTEVPEACPSCGNVDILPRGIGTERLEEEIGRRFPERKVLRIDRDSVSRKHEAEKAFAKVHRGEVDILVGTQMIAKGHDFYNVGLVVILNSDAQILSPDARAKERLFATLMQVAGRAGRHGDQGRVVIQTRLPEDPLFGALEKQDYRGFAESLVEERKENWCVPFVHQALVTAQAKTLAEALYFLNACAKSGFSMAPEDVRVFDPVPMPLVRLMDVERAQLLVEADGRASLNRFLWQWQATFNAPSGIDWTIEVDPASI